MTVFSLMVTVVRGMHGEDDIFSLFQEPEVDCGLLLCIEFMSGIFKSNMK